MEGCIVKNVGKTTREKGDGCFCSARRNNVVMYDGQKKKKMVE